MKARTLRKPARLLIGALMLFYFSAFALLAIRKPSPLSVGMALLVPAILLVSVMALPKLFPADKLLLTLTNFLCALGVLVLFRLDEQKGLTQAVNYGVGVGCMLICILAVRYIKSWKILTPLMALASLGLLALPLLFGKESGGALAWVSIAGMNFQPSEMVKLCLLVISAWLLSRKRLIPCVIFAAACLGMLMLQKDLGTALLYYGVTLAMVFASTGSLLLTGLGLLGGAGAAVVGYTRFAHVKKRVAIWLNPWYDYQGSGYQIVQSLIAMVNGGLFGMGLGAGNATVIPAYSTDFIFAVILNEFGVLFGLCVLLMYLAIIIRGASVALRARTSFHALLALGCTALIAIQTFVIIGGNIKLIPLTGVTLPFISYGGTSLVSSLCVVGLLQGVASLNDEDVREDRALAAREEEA